MTAGPVPASHLSDDRGPPFSTSGESQADFLVFVDQGVIVERGVPRELLANPAQERTRAFLSKVI